MKNIIAVSAAALVLATGASAATYGAATINKFAPEADVSSLSPAAIAHILSTINDDGDDSFVQTQAQVRSLIKNVQ